MGQAPGEIRDRIEQQRDELTQEINQVQDAVKERLNVREFIDQHPREALAIAIAGGLAFASFMRQRSSNGFTSQREPEQRQEFMETLDLTRSALMGVAKQQLQSFKSGVTQG